MPLRRSWESRSLPGRRALPRSAAAAQCAGAPGCPSPPRKRAPPKKSVLGTEVGEAEGHWEMTRNPEIPRKHQFGGWYPKLTTWCAQDSKLKDDLPLPTPQNQISAQPPVRNPDRPSSGMW